MVLSLSADQEAALGQDAQRVVVAVQIDLTADLLYCTGADAVTLAATTYEPRALELGNVQVSDPRTSRATVTIDDTDGEIATAWYSERFSGQTVTVTEAIKKDGVWIVTRTIPWICTTCDRRSDGSFVLHLSGAGGLKPRAGLQVASRADFSMAPEPGTSIRIGGSSTTVR